MTLIDPGGDKAHTATPKRLRPTPPARVQSPSRVHPAASRRRPPMNKTGARLLGAFIASLIAWIWQGWFQPLTGVPMDTTMVASLGAACVVLTEWALVPDTTRRRTNR